jgi:hypothetical protein
MTTSKFVNIHEFFIVFCLYFFQGKDDKLKLLLNDKYKFDLTLPDADVKSLILRQFICQPTEKQELLLLECILTILKYRTIINRYHQTKLTQKIAIPDTAINSRKMAIRKLHDLINNFIDIQIWDEKALPRYTGDSKYTKNAIISYTEAILAYLLRGYCRYLVDEQSTCTTLSLNDFTQSFYLAQKLRDLLSNDDADENMLASFDQYYATTNCSRLPFIYHCIKDQYYEYIANWLFIYIEMFRGNVYYKLYDYDSAFENYCGAITLFKQLASRSDINNALSVYQNSNEPLPVGILAKIKELSCKTIAKAYFEKAKCYFGIGQFLDALKWHLKALMELLLISIPETADKSDIEGRLKLYFDMIEVVRYLDYEKEQTAFDKTVLRNFFEPTNNSDQYFNECKEICNTANASDPLRKEIEKAIEKENKYVEKYCVSDKSIIAPERFKKIIAPEYKHIAADIIVRIGFLLFTLREKHFPLAALDRNKLFSDWASKLNKRNAGYIKPFFKPDKIWKGLEKSYGDYCLYILEDHGETPRLNMNDFKDDWERIFAFFVLQTLTEKPLDITTPDEARIAITLGKYSMANIENIITQPRMLYTYLMRDGYKERAKEFRDRKSGGLLNKLVVLRRWQSFNPKIPRPRNKHVLGGGYFLMWEGKGIVIDPGYNFIENFYEEGFSLKDIDSVVITHSHPDHDDELSTILTLLFEWNETCNKTLTFEKKGKHIDLFLNEGSYRKYSNWLYAPKSIVGKIYQLQSNMWDSGAQDPSADKKDRGNNIELCLRGKDGYSLCLEVIPSWHDEIIAKHSSIGLKFKLYEQKSQKPNYIIGITGDTNAYKGIEAFYEDCDILIAHLGDIKFKEIRTCANITMPYKEIKERFFSGPQKVHSRKQIRQLLNFFALLDLVDMEQALKNKDDIEFLEKVVQGDGVIKEHKKLENIIEELFVNINKDFEYKYHLGLKGLYNLHAKLCAYRKKSKLINKINPYLIIGEFPEELGSYKQLVARTLNEMPYNQIDQHGKINVDSYPEKFVSCFTGDIGLHIGINIKQDLPLSVRCDKCNQNNELVKINHHYHRAEEIQETIVKGANNSMLYLCSTYRHAVFPLYKPTAFVIRHCKNLGYSINAIKDSTQTLYP